MKKFLSGIILSAAALTLPAASGFVENFEQGLTGQWQTAGMGYNGGLDIDKGQKNLAVKGFVNPVFKGHPWVAVERKFDECQGDFTAALDLQYDMIDNAFMGEVMLQVIGSDGKLAAEIGVLDGWIAGRAVTLVNSESVRPKKQQRFGGINHKGEGKFTIERSGSEYIFALNGKKLCSVSKEIKPVNALRILFKQTSYGGNAAKKIPAAHFGNFTVKKVTFESVTLSGNFSEKPVNGWDPAWRTVGAVGADALQVQAADNGLLVDGFVNENKAKIKATEVILERKLNPVKGDFTAVMDMAWDQIDHAFMGEVMLQVLDAQGNELAEVGLRDVWIGYYGRAGYGLNGKKEKPLIEMPRQAAGAFVIERRGDVYTMRLRDWKFMESKGSKAPAAALQLVFARSRFNGNDKLPPSHFGKFVIKELAFKDSVDERKSAAEQGARKVWKHTEPIIWYWAGPDMSDEFAAELAAAGFNVAFGRNMFDLDIMHRHGLRGVLWMPGLPDTPERKAQLKLWLESVRNHPAMLGVSCGDEPGGTERMRQAQMRVEFMIENAPELLHFNNMYPYGASNAQLGTEGLPTAAYQAHIEKYCRLLKPQLLSYDHYTFFRAGDRGTYFNNQAMIRKAALERNIPSMNIVQGAAWAFHWRVPTPQEYRYLAYTSLAYGSQGLSCYVYSYKGHWGSMRDPITGKTGPLYEEAKVLNREFVAIAKELMELKSLHPYHTGEIPFGVETLPDDCEFQLEPKLKNFSQGLKDPTVYKQTDDNIFALRPPVTGWIVSTFGKDNKASHVLVVNLDYKKAAKTTLTAPGKLEKFDAVKRTWSAVNSNKAALDVPAGSGVLLRLAK